MDDLVDQLSGQCLVAPRQAQCDHADTIFETFQVTLAVEGLERIAGVVLERAQKALEAEFRRVSLIEQRRDEAEVVLVEHLLLVVALFHQVVELFLQRVEEHRILVHVLQEILTRRFTILVELQTAIGVVQVQHGVERVVIERLGVVIGSGSRCRIFF